jgi:ribosomal protein S18 acetylase RimI-like enzyme
VVHSRRVEPLAYLAQSPDTQSRDTCPESLNRGSSGVTAGRGRCFSLCCDRTNDRSQKRIQLQYLRRSVVILRIEPTIVERMTRHQVTLRTANPTFEDGLACARYANQASEGFMRVMFGRRFEDIIATAFMQTGHDTSYQNVIFAERDNDIVGMILAYTEAQHRHSSRQPQRKAAGRLRLRMRVVELVLAPLMRLNDSIEEGDFYLQFIAVDQSIRAGGVGSALMDALEEEALAHGSTRLSLDVSTSNEVARRFYEHRGWVINWEWPKVWFIPSLSVRMTKPL